MLFGVSLLGIPSRLHVLSGHSLPPAPALCAYCPHTHWAPALIFRSPPTPSLAATSSPNSSSSSSGSRPLPPPSSSPTPPSPSLDTTSSQSSPSSSSGSRPLPLCHLGYTPHASALHPYHLWIPPCSTLSMAALATPRHCLRPPPLSPLDASPQPSRATIALSMQHPRTTLTQSITISPLPTYTHLATTRTITISLLNTIPDLPAHLHPTPSPCSPLSSRCTMLVAIHPPTPPDRSPRTSPGRTRPSASHLPLRHRQAPAFRRRAPALMNSSSASPGSALIVVGLPPSSYSGSRPPVPSSPSPGSCPLRRRAPALMNTSSTFQGSRPHRRRAPALIVISGLPPSSTLQGSRPHRRRAPALFVIGLPPAPLFGNAGLPPTSIGPRRLRTSPSSPFHLHPPASSSDSRPPPPILLPLLARLPDSPCPRNRAPGIPLRLLALAASPCIMAAPLTPPLHPHATPFCFPASVKRLPLLHILAPPPRDPLASLTPLRLRRRASCPSHTTIGIVATPSCTTLPAVSGSLPGHLVCLLGVACLTITAALHRHRAFALVSLFHCCETRSRTLRVAFPIWRLHYP